MLGAKTTPDVARVWQPSCPPPALGYTGHDVGLACGVLRLLVKAVVRLRGLRGLL